MDERDLFGKVKEAEVVRICGDLVRLQSVNPPGNERAAAEYVFAVGFLPVLKIPLILFGPGEPGQAHQPNEQVEISKLLEAARIFTVTAASLLQ